MSKKKEFNETKERQASTNRRSDSHPKGDNRPKDVFEDPVGYLAGLGIDSSLVLSIAAPLPRAA